MQPVVTTELCGRVVAADRALVMAIVNRTPDSFYDRGATFTDEAAMQRVDDALGEGADLIDVGGVKAGPGETISVAEEIDRVAVFVEAVRRRHPEVLISIDTWRSEVAHIACAAGADLINDTWAGHDPELKYVAAQHRAGLVCSHTGGAIPRSRPFRVRYDDVVDEVTTDLCQLAQAAVDVGVDRRDIIIDPTHDFGKNTYHGLSLLRHVDVLVNTGWPVLMALSNKDFIGETLGVGVDERLEGTLACTALAASAGARIFRVHQVAATRRVVEMVASVRGTRAPTCTIRGLA